MTQERVLSKGIPYFLKTLLVLIFPLQFSSESLIELLMFPPSGFLFTPVYSYPEIITEFIWIMYSGSIILRNFVIGMIIIFPGILFSHKLSKAPVEKNYWKRSVGAAAAIYFVSIAMISITSLMMYNPYGFEWDVGYYQFYSKLMYFPTLVIGVFIILPMVQRQAATIGSPKYLHHYSISDLESNTKLSFTRERIISVILWIFLCFGPFAIAFSPYYYYSIPAISPLMTYYYGVYGGYLRTTYNLTGNFIDFSSLPFIAFVCIFQFFFVRDIYRYLRKEISRQRMVSMAIFSIFAPLLMMTLISLPMGMNSTSLIPLPLLQVIGAIAIRYHRPRAQQIDRVWEDVPHRMWWEKSVEKPIPVMTTPERPIRHSDEELLTIPLTYLVLSKLRSLNHRRS